MNLCLTKPSAKLVLAILQLLTFAPLSVLSSVQSVPLNVLVSGGDCLSGRARVGNAEAEQAVDPTNGYVYEVWMGCNGIGFARSLDGGQIFQPPYTVPGFGNDSAYYDPAVAVSQNGTVYVSYIATTYCCFRHVPGSAPMVVVSRDHGASFSGPYLVTSPPGPSSKFFSDRDFLAISPRDGSVFVTWVYAPNATLAEGECTVSCWSTRGTFNVMISRSVDGGRTWSRSTPINPDYPNGGAGSAPLVVEKSGQVDVLYAEGDHNSTNWLLAGHEYFVASTDGGQTWSPRMALDGANGSFLTASEWWIDGSLSQGHSSNGSILYASFDTQSKGNESWVTYSLDDGKTWAVPQRVGATVYPQDLHISVEVSGADHSGAYLAWYVIDRSGGWHVYAQSIKVASDGTATFSSPIEVSNQTGVAGVWGGDTLGVSSLNGGAVVSWGYGVRSKISVMDNISEIFEAPILMPQQIPVATAYSLALAIAVAITIGAIVVVKARLGRHLPESTGRASNETRVARGHLRRTLMPSHRVSVRMLQM